MRFHRNETSQKTMSTSDVKEFIRRHERLAFDHSGNSTIKFDSLYARIFLVTIRPIRGCLRTANALTLVVFLWSPDRT